LILGQILIPRPAISTASSFFSSERALTCTELTLLRGSLIAA